MRSAMDKGGDPVSEAIDAQNPSLFSRRNMLCFAAAASGFAVIRPSLASASRTGKKRIRIHHLHTGEELETVYWRGGSYVRSALHDLDHVLRDWRTGEVERIDPDVIDMVHDVVSRTDGLPAQIISGYRSPKTNANLAANGSGVARRSYHMRGKAIDFRLEGFSAGQVYEVAWDLQRGGVGLYTRSNFVHVDSGPVRTWGS